MEPEVRKALEEGDEEGEGDESGRGDGEAEGKLVDIREKFGLTMDDANGTAGPSDTTEDLATIYSEADLPPETQRTTTEEDTARSKPPPSVEAADAYSSAVDTEREADAKAAGAAAVEEQPAAAAVASAASAPDSAATAAAPPASTLPSKPRRRTRRGHKPRLLARFRVNKFDTISVFRAMSREDFRDVVKLLPDNTPLPASDKMTYLIARLELAADWDMDQRL